MINDISSPISRCPEKFGRWYLLVVGVIHLSLLAYGIYAHGPCWDEVGHLPAGLSHWQTGRFDLYRVNPPLARMVATAPVLAMDAHIQWRWDTAYGKDRPEWKLGRELISHNGPSYLRLLRLARLSCLVFAVIGLYLVWKWSSDLFGTSGAMLSVTVWAFSPIVITNAQLMTPDMAAASVGAAACYSFRNWLNNQSTKNALLCGAILGLAELTKFTWLILYFVWPIQWGVRWFVLRQQSNRVTSLSVSIVHLVMIFSVSLYVVNCGYLFEGSFRRLGSYEFLSSTLSGNVTSSGHPFRGNRFSNSILGNIPVPLPANMVQGIDRQKVDFDSGFNSYLRGEWRQRGWWYYYLYGVIVKEPIGFIALGTLAIVGIVVVRITRAGIAEAVDLLFPSVMLFTFVSSQTGFNHHIRYVLPALIFMAIALGFTVSSRILAHRAMKTTAWILVGSGVLGSLSQFPNTHAFFNIFAGGPRNGPFHLLDSNVDWGQDVLLLDNWAKKNPGRPLTGVAHAIPDWTGIRDLTTLQRNSVPKVIRSTHTQAEINPSGAKDDGPKPGRFALSVRAIYEKNWGYTYFQQMTPVEYVGQTIRIYELSESDVIRIREQYGYPPLGRKSNPEASR